MTRTINLSNTQFRNQLVFLYTFLVKYGWLKVAFGICCLGKACGGIFQLAACFDFYNLYSLSYLHKLVLTCTQLHVIFVSVKVIVCSYMYIPVSEVEKLPQHVKPRKDIRFNFSRDRVYI